MGGVNSGDDGSTDKSVDIVNHHYVLKNSSLVKRLAAFHLELHEHNQGLSAARNTGFKLSSTEYVLILDADNYLHSQACEYLLRALIATSKNTGAVYPILAVEGHPVQKIANELPWDPQRFRHGNYIDAMSLVRREAWRKVGGFHHSRRVGRF